MFEEVYMLCLVKKIETKIGIKIVDKMAKNATNSKLPVKKGWVSNT